MAYFQVAKLVNKVLDELFPDPDIQVIAEPGRYISDTSVTLYNSINNIRHVSKFKNEFWWECVLQKI